MGILRNGFYTRGYKTTEEIYDMLGMRYGDTVFDTTRKEKRVYDGQVWVSGNMITKSFVFGGTVIGGIEYKDSAKSGQMVGYRVNPLNPGDQVISTGFPSSGGGNENAIGFMQFPINRSYGNSISSTVWGAVQYSGEGFVWLANSGANTLGQYVVAQTPPTYGGVPGNYYYFVGFNNSNVSPNPNEVGVYTYASPAATVVTSSSGGFTGSIYINKALIRFGEIN